MSTTPDNQAELAPADYCDPVIEAFKKDVDRTLLRENLKLTVEERLLKAQSRCESIPGPQEGGTARSEGRAAMIASLERIIAELQALLEGCRKRDTPPAG